MAEIILANLTDINGFATNTVAVAGTAYSASSQGIYLVAATGAFAFTLPSGSQMTTGGFVIVKDIGGNAGTNNITISGTIDGSSSVSISSNYGEFWLAWNGSAWSVLGAYRTTPRLTKAGNATLDGGTVTVADTAITASSIVMLTVKTTGGTPGSLTYTVSAGASFTINSSSGTDTSTISYSVMEP